MFALLLLFLVTLVVDFKALAIASILPGVI